MPLKTGMQLIRDLSLAVFPLNGKGQNAKAPTPQSTGWQHYLAQDNAHRTAQILETGAYGIVLKPEIIILDFDLYKLEGLETFNSLSPLPPTLTFETGRGGKHYWYKRPNSLETQDLKVRKSHPDYPALEVLTRGCYVVGPGSTINGNLYPLNEGEIAELPHRIWDLFKIETLSPQQIAVANKSEKTILYEAEEKKYRHWLSSYPKATHGDRDTRTFKAAAVGKDLGLSNDTIFSCLMDWQQFSSHPWPPEELAAKIAGSFKYGSREPGCEAVDLDEFEDYQDPDLGSMNPIDADIQSDGYYMDRAGNPVLTIANASMFFKTYRPGNATSAEDSFLGLFRYNLMTDQVEFTRKPFWRNPGDDGDLVLRDIDLIQICKAASSRKFNMSEYLAQSAVEAEAYKNCYHPIRTWLESLKWDGQKRIHKLLIEYFQTHPKDLGSDETHYRRYLGIAFMLAAIGRAMDPGCKWDIMLVLAGPPALGKSMFVEILGGEYARAMYKMGTDKHSLQAMDGGWFIEYPEISAVSKKEISEVKAFISATSDTFMPSYGRTVKTRKRSCVMVWTLNPKGEDDGFLKDTTGNRKFWVVDVRGKLDFDSFIADREQLFAEAMAMYEQGERAYKYVSDKKTLEHSEVVQEGNLDVDPWFEEIQDWVRLNIYKFEKIRHEGKWCWKIRINTVMEQCLGFYHAKDRFPKNQSRVKACLIRLGFEYRRTNSERYLFREVQEWEEL